jgi:hypothetical protein
MATFATTVLLASSLASCLALPTPGHARPADIEPNLMLRNAAVDHDLAKVKHRIEKMLHGKAADSSAASALPPMTR